MTISYLAAWATILALLAAIVPLAFSAKRYLTIRNAELRKEQFDTYHHILRVASAGVDEYGVLKLVSQIAFIYELRNFPEYVHLTEKVLGMLRDEWGCGEAGERKERLLEAIDETLAYLILQRRA